MALLLIAFGATSLHFCEGIVTWVVSALPSALLGQDMSSNLENTFLTDNILSDWTGDITVSCKLSFQS